MLGALHLLLVGTGRVEATALIVPDQATTIQAAINAGPDTVMVRPGYYPEVLTIADRIVLRRLVPAGSTEQPEVDGFLLDYTHNAPTSGPVITEGFAFRGRISIINESTPNDIVFNACRLDSGLTSSGRDTWILRLSHCVIFGTARLLARAVIADSNVVVGRISINAEGLARIRGNTVSGVGGVGIFGGLTPDCEVSGNHVIGFERGIDIGAESSLRILNNSIQGCTSNAIRAEGRSVMTVSDNTVTECQGGLVLDANDILASRNTVVGTATPGMIVLGGSRSVVEGNIVTGCGGAGIVVRSLSDSRAERNIVGRCGGDGILIEGGLHSSVQSNTIYLNAGHAIAFENFDVGVIARNVGFRNGGSGLNFPAPGEINCNDWFENVGGAIAGQPTSGTDVAVDPIFCDLANDDVSLSAGSPLLGLAACGQIGALGQGCDIPTATLVTLFTAEPVAEGIRLRWQVSNAGDGFSAWLERADAVEGPWSRVETEQTVDGEVTVELDRGVSSNRTYWYRLVASESGEVMALGPPIEATASPQARFGLIRVGPNPSRGPIQVEFALAEQAQVEIDVFDVQGRSVATLTRGAWPAGRHHVAWSGVTARGTAASGVYLVRYRFPGGQEHRRIVRAQ